MSAPRLRRCAVLRTALVVLSCHAACLGTAPLPRHAPLRGGASELTRLWFRRTRGRHAALCRARARGGSHRTTEVRDG
jgi:hypothetical protein